MKFACEATGGFCKILAGNWCDLRVIDGWYICKCIVQHEKNKLRFFVSVVIILLKVSFIENAVPELIDGATLAESMIGYVYVGDNAVVFGDPTFHYSS